MNEYEQYGTASIETVVLEKMRWQLSQGVASDLLQGVDVDMVVNEIIRGVEYRFFREVFTDKLHSISIEYPKTWWDAVKLRFFPKWLLDRKPATIVRHSVDAYALYPRIAAPHHEHYMHIVEDVRNVWKISEES